MRVLNTIPLADETLRQVICSVCRWAGVTREIYYADAEAATVIQQAVEQKAEKPLRAGNDPIYQDYLQRFKQKWASFNSGLAAKNKQVPLNYEVFTARLEDQKLHPEKYDELLRLRT